MRLRLQGKIIALVLIVVLAVFISITWITMMLNRAESMRQAEELSISMAGSGGEWWGQFAPSTRRFTHSPVHLLVFVPLVPAFRAVVLVRFLVVLAPVVNIGADAHRVLFSP